jgi:chromosome partitioning protein
MARTIVWGNQKGGVTKSTSCAVTSCILSQEGYKVLCCDFDPQGHLAPIITGQPKDDFSDYNILVAIEENDHDSHIVELTNNLHIIPCDRYLANFSDYAKETFPDDPFEQTQILKNFLAPIKSGYDFVMIDTPPGLELLTLNALAAADNTIALVQPVELAFSALNEYIDTVEKLKHNGTNPKLDIIGVLLTLVDRGQNVDEDFIKAAYKVYPDLMFKSMVYRRTRLKQYPSIGLLEAKDSSYIDRSALRPYKEMVKELLVRVEG